MKEDKEKTCWECYWFQCSKKDEYKDNSGVYKGVCMEGSYDHHTDSDTGACGFFQEEN